MTLPGREPRTSQEDGRRQRKFHPSRSQRAQCNGPANVRNVHSKGRKSITMSESHVCMRCVAPSPSPAAVFLKSGCPPCYPPYTLFFKVVSSSQNAQAFRLEAEYFATQHARRERESKQDSIRKGLAAHLAASDLLWSAALRADEDSGRSGENASRARKSASCRLRAGVGDPGLVESLCRGGEEQQQQPARRVLQQQQQQGQQARAQHCYKKDPIRIRRKKVRRRRSLRRHRCAGRLSSLSSRGSGPSSLSLQQLYTRR